MAARYRLCKLTASMLQGTRTEHKPAAVSGAGRGAWYGAAHAAINEFKMMWALRESFPLHYIVFKQTACHIPHEANVEQIFSRAGLLSDPNLDPIHLSTFVKIGINKKSFKPAQSTPSRRSRRCITPSSAAGSTARSSPARRARLGPPVGHNQVSGDVCDATRVYLSLYSNT